MRIIKQLFAGATTGAVVLDAVYNIEEGKLSKNLDDHMVVGGVGALLGLLVAGVVLFIGRR